jgi:hypothetical protein
MTGRLTPASASTMYSASSIQARVFIGVSLWDAASQLDSFKTPPIVSPERIGEYLSLCKHQRAAEP